MPGIQTQCRTVGGVIGKLMVIPAFRITEKETASPASWDSLCIGWVLSGSETDL